jgi:hypothetical protein
MRHHLEVCQRDDGQFQIGIEDEAVGPFPSRQFSWQVASGHPPTPAPIAKFRSLKLRRSRDAACTA